MNLKCDVRSNAGAKSISNVAVKAEAAEANHAGGSARLPRSLVPLVARREGLD